MLKTISIENWKDKIEALESEYKRNGDGQIMEEIRRLSALVLNEEELLRSVSDEAQKPLVSDDNRVEVIMLCIHNDRDWALKSVAGIFLTKYPFKLTIYENSLNTKNTSKIWNKLIKESTCPYVCLIDSDAVPQNDFLTPMIETLHKFPNVAVVGSVTGDKSVTTAQSMQPRRDKVPIEIDGHISGYCMLFKKKIFDEVGYFDEDFVFYGQESDWIERVLETKKYRVMIDPRAHVTHGENGEASISSQRLDQAGEFSRMRDAEYARAMWHLKKKQRTL